ncbi:MAG: histidine--tRNA ligase [Betaproteobacteria bacterium RIFCSPLOWO2_12_FULL_65_14]|nr:MAG: histidine--tRNA ligase [Betaproteobacteria bacterium RIFCSPLOWO2_12_FULL_65_14]
MHKVQPALLRGFDQEYLPREQLQFNALIEIIRKNFELFGFLPIETPSAERKEVLTSKGGVEKEIYALSRLAADAEGDEASTKGALRFDLTVPLARYVAMRERELAFPFRRYQIQRVWRGETPQARKGRFREFYQCDIDIINRDKLSYLAEAEIPSVIYSVFKEMAIGEFRIRINNRKVLKGLLQDFDVADRDSAAILRVLDKVEKEDASKIRDDLVREGMASSQAERLYRLISLKRTTDETLDALAELKVRNEMYGKGVAELRNIAAAIRQFGVPDSAFCVDLGVVRGLDYYTGTIYETTLVDHPGIGSICSGGRYDDLASYFTDTKLPGVGISIGLTRLFSKLREAGLLRPAPRTPAEVLVTTMDHQYLGRYLAIARRLREAGINTEVYLETAKLKNQLAYADKKGFRVALIAGETEFGRDRVQVKNLSTKTARECALEQVVSAVRETLNDSSKEESS